MKPKWLSKRRFYGIAGTRRRHQKVARWQAPVTNVTHPDYVRKAIHLPLYPSVLTFPQACSYDEEV